MTICFGLLVFLTHPRFFCHNNFDNFSLIHCLKRYTLQVRHKQDWGQGFILLLPQAAVLPESDAGSGVIKPASSFLSKTIRPCAPCGAQCIGHTVRTWSVVCSGVPHLQFGEGSKPHLCMHKWNHSTAVHKQLSLTQAAQGKPIPTGLALVPGTKTQILEAPSQYSTSICSLSIQRHKCQVWQGCPKDSAQLAQMCVWILVSLGKYLRIHLRDHTRYDQGPDIYSGPKRVSRPFGEAQLAGCLRVCWSGI